MAKITTDDCKNFLIQCFPSTQLALWKRIKKNKDSEGFDIRVFEYNKSSSVMVKESSGTLSLVSSLQENQVLAQEFNEHKTIKSTAVEKEKSKSAKTAADYIFCVKNIQEDDDQIAIFITPLAFWKKKGYMNDQPDYKPLDFFPKEWIAAGIDDVNEGGTWMMPTHLSKEEVHQTMIDQGFIYEEDFEKFISNIF